MVHNLDCDVKAELTHLHDLLVAASESKSHWCMALQVVTDHNEVESCRFFGPSQIVAATLRMQYDSLRTAQKLLKALRMLLQMDHMGMKAFVLLLGNSKEIVVADTFAVLGRGHLEHLHQLLQEIFDLSVLKTTSTYTESHATRKHEWNGLFRKAHARPQVTGL